MFSDEILEHLREFKVANVLIPLADGSVFTCEGLIRIEQSPTLDARFEPGQLHHEQIDSSAVWRFSCTVGLKILTLQAKPLSIDDASVQLKTVNVHLSGDPRRHFRLDTDLYLKYWTKNEPQPEEKVLQRVNLSGDGIRFTGKHSLQVGQRVNMEIHLPGEKKQIITCAGLVVRVGPTTDDEREAALQIVDIRLEQLEKMMSFCVEQKFLEMKNKAQFLSRVLSKQD